MSRARYTAGATGKFTGTLRDEDGTALASGSLATLTLTLRDAASGSIVNARNAQNVLNANDVAVDGAGVLTWAIKALDTTLLVADLRAEEHIAIFAWTYAGGAKVGKAEHRLRCVDELQLCTFDDVKLQLPEIADSDQDFVEMLIDAFSERAERETSRRFHHQTDTEVFSPMAGQSALRLRRYPIASVTSVKEDYGGEFSVAIALTADTYDTASLGDRGILQLRARSFLAAPGSVQVVYVGGLAREPGGVPSDLRMAAIRQVAYWYQRRASLGISGESVSGMSVSINATQDLLEDVRRALANYAPRTIC